MDLGSDINLWFLDFSKAFDVVKHQIICTKLPALGASDHMITWIRSIHAARTL